MAFELRDACPRCGYGMVDTAYRDATHSDSESNEDNAEWNDEDYEDVDDCGI